MKTVSGKVTSTIPISLSNAAKSLSKFASSNHQASHAVSLYLQRAADSFNQLVKVHKKLNPQKEHSTDDIKVDEFSESKKNLGESAKNDDEVKDEKLIKTEKRVDIDEGEMEKSEKNEVEFVKVDKVKDKKVIKTEKRVDRGEGEMGKSKKNDVGFVKIDKVKDKKLIKTEKRLDVGEGETENSKKNEVEFVKIDTVKDKKVINTEKRVDRGEGEMKKYKKNELEFVKIDSSTKVEPELKEDVVTSKDKKKRKKKNRGVGDSEQDVVKVEDLGNKAEEEGKKRKSLDLDGGENAGSTEQRSKKKSKKRRIEVIELVEL